jgi:hypothetical protein
MLASRMVVNRLLDEKDTGVTITTVVKAGRALGMTCPGFAKVMTSGS